MESVPLSLAFVAGGLSVLNPCGFALLPAFLTFYVGADDTRLPKGSTRVAQGLLVGILVTVGFLGLFAVVGLPVVYGAVLLASAMPFAGMAIGVTLTAVGVVALTGRHVALGGLRPSAPGERRRARTMLLFGVAYGLASLGCTLPIFLTLVGAALGAGGGTSSLVIFGAYGLGMALVLMALSVGAALVRGGLARRLRSVLPHLPRLTGGLLVLAGSYLTYYWWRVRYGDRVGLSSDPLVGRVTRMTARLQSLAEGQGILVLALAALVVVLAALAVWRHRSIDRRHLVSHPEGAPHGP